MGLIKKDGYLVKGVEIKPAYTKITRMYLENKNNAVAYFGISNNRENLNDGKILEEIAFNCEIDKKQDKIFTEIYIKAKEELFADWKDDIVTGE